MKLYDDFGGQNNNRSSGATMVIVTLFILTVLGMVLLVNQSDKNNGNTNIQPVVPVQENTEEVSEDILVSSETVQEESLGEESQASGTSSGLTSDDLDIWDVTQEDDENADIAAIEDVVSENEAIKEEELHKNQTLIEYSNGESQWVNINPYIIKNKYDYTNLVFQKPIMKYYEDGEKVSFLGVDVSEEQGFVDFNQLKKEGVEFAMIRVGVRGYSTGKLVADDSFYDHMKGATDAMMHVGVIFISNAVTVEEAAEEATFVEGIIKEFKIDYPVAIQFGGLSKEKSRADSLTVLNRTKVVLAFMQKMETNGHIPMVYGNKEWLLKKIDLTQFEKYDIWLAQEKDIPDYPYEFGMWQYSKGYSLDGIAETANLNISFIDYSIK